MRYSSSRTWVAALTGAALTVAAASAAPPTFDATARDRTEAGAPVRTSAGVRLPDRSPEARLAHLLREIASGAGVDRDASRRLEEETDRIAAASPTSARTCAELSMATETDPPADTKSDPPWA